jgi:hypothetical protein
MPCCSVHTLETSCSPAVRLSIVRAAPTPHLAKAPDARPANESDRSRGVSARAPVPRNGSTWLAPAPAVSAQG